MSFVIQNRAGHLLVLPFNSGGTLHLAPGETSAPIEAFELEKNEKVERLSKQGLVVVAESDAALHGAGDASAAATPAGLTDSKARRRGGSQN